MREKNESLGESLGGTRSYSHSRRIRRPGPSDQKKKTNRTWPLQGVGGRCFMRHTYGMGRTDAKERWEGGPGAVITSEDFHGSMESRSRLKGRTKQWEGGVGACTMMRHASIVWQDGVRGIKKHGGFILSGILKVLEKDPRQTNVLGIYQTFNNKAIGEGSKKSTSRGHPRCPHIGRRPRSLGLCKHLLKFQEERVEGQRSLPRTL